LVVTDFGSVFSIEYRHDHKRVFGQRGRAGRTILPQGRDN
jgi:hypothetical protein